MDARAWTSLVLAVAAPALLASCSRSEPTLDLGIGPPGSAAPGATAAAAPSASFRYKAPYQLTTAPGWDPHRDANVTVDRCRDTSWSYAGCETVFPEEGRAHLAEACASGQQNPRVQRIICTRLAEYQIRGVGGPKEEAKGVATVSRYCDEDDKIACAVLAKHLVPTDREKARAYFQRGCANKSQAPMGMCQELDRMLADR